MLFLLPPLPPRHDVVVKRKELEKEGRKAGTRQEQGAGRNGKVRRKEGREAWSVVMIFPSLKPRKKEEGRKKEKTKEGRRKKTGERTGT